jgi:glycosyltransferase involved in cell wall biosynthesis
MNVLYLNTSGQIGGAETSLSTLMESLRKLHPDWRLTLLLGEDGPLAAYAGKLGVKVQVLPLPRELAHLGGNARFGFDWTWRALRSLAATLHYRTQLKAAIRESHPHVIHTNGSKMHFLVASFSRKEFGGGEARVCHVHDYVNCRPLERWLLKAGSRRFDRIVANSVSVTADLLAIPLPQQKVISIHNGVEIGRFSPAGETLDLDRLSGLPEARPGVVRVGLVAAFAKWKGHIIFMRALALLPRSLNVRAYAIGGPIYRTSGSQYTFDELRAAAATNCPAVEFGFTGVVEPIETAYRALDIVVHASTDPEPFGMVIIEAMACQKPVIVSRGGGAAEIFEDGVTALAHNPGDAAMLARQIEHLAKDARLRASLGERGRAAVAAHFQAGAMAARFAELYCELAAGRPAGAYARSGGEKKCFA